MALELDEAADTEFYDIVDYFKKFSRLDILLFQHIGLFKY